MPLESANWISELDITNPAPTDAKRQGDDHLRMIKSVLKACFPNASKAFYLPDTRTLATAYSVVAADQNRIILLTTAGGSYTVTLPTLTVGDAGWECTFVKTTLNINPVFFAPASGVITSGEYSGSKIRRCIPGVPFKAIWTGANWILTRAVQAPLGAVIQVHAVNLPVGYEWASGTTLSSASTNYPEYYAVNSNSGIVPDMRDRVGFGRTDMGGAAASRITIEAGAQVIGSPYGSDRVILGQTNLPNYSLPVSDPSHGHGVTDPGHSHTLGPWVIGTSTSNFSNSAAGGDFNGPRSVSTVSSVNGAFTGISIQGAFTGIGVTLNGGGQPFSKLPPGLVTNYVVVVE